MTAGYELLDTVHPMEGSEDFIEVESTFFVGERIRKVSKEAERYTIQSDYFTLHVFLHSTDYTGDSLSAEEALDNCCHSRFQKLYDFQHHLKHRCRCGGTGEVLEDCHGDYVVRCRSCGKSKYADMVLQYAIRD